MTHAEIYDVLRRAGVEVRPGRMVCPKCEHRSVTASADKGIAKCWKCEKVWTTNPDQKRAQSWDWAAILLTPLAEACKGDIGSDGDARMWLLDRGLPIDDPEWLYEQDLGTIPCDLDRHLPGWIAKAKERLSEEISTFQIQAMGLRAVLENQPGRPKKETQIRIHGLESAAEDAKQAFEHLTTHILPLLLKSEWIGSVVYVYRDEEGVVTSLNVRQISSEYETEDHPYERKVIRIQPRPNRRGLFGVDDAQYAPGEGWGDKVRTPILVEGEHNLLSLRAAYRRWGPKYFLPVVAVGGKNGADVDCLERLVGDEGEPLIIYDNDRVNENTGKPAGHDLVDAVSSVLYIYKATTSTKDLDDWFKANPQATPQQFLKEILSKARFCPISMDSIRSRVLQALTEPKVEANRREMAVRKIIIDDLQRRAKLYQVDGYSLALLPDYASDEDKASLIPVRKGNIQYAQLASEYGLVIPKWIDSLGQGINIATLQAEHNALHSLSHFDGNSLYVNCYDGTFIRLRPREGRVQIKRFVNGTDGVLMREFDASSPMCPWLPPDIDLSQIFQCASGMQHRPDSLFESKILGTVIYERDEALYKQLLKSWVLSIFFGGHHRNRPVIMAEGSGGSGKGSLGATIGYLLIGPRFSVTNSPKDGNALAELMTDTPYVVFDEWDNLTKEVENSFKHLTTGGKHRRRELYTTSKVVELSCDAAVFLTTNSNPMKQAGTSRRYIKLPIGPRQTRPGEKVFRSTSDYLLPTFMEHRTRLWLDLIADLASCVLALNSTEPSTKTSFSMSDFGVFVQRVATYEGWGDEAAQLLIKAEHQQDKQAAEALRLGTLIPELLRFNPSLQGKFLPAREWADYLQQLIPEHDRETRERVVSSYITHILKVHSEVFRRTCGMEIGYDKHDEVRTYSFRLFEKKEYAA